MNSFINHICLFVYLYVYLQLLFSIFDYLPLYSNVALTKAFPFANKTLFMYFCMKYYNIASTRICFSYQIIP